MYSISNVEFLQTIFEGEYLRAHTTSFRDDPANIDGERRGICWGGHPFGQRPLLPDSNQYFTISLFRPDPDTGRQYRRKALFEATYVIVADDVKEKLPVERVKLLPPPTYILETSPGSEQWGWVLVTPETNRTRVENLLDGLVERGLAPDGRDPGMKGVTRYVRLPEGVNTKTNKAQVDFITGEIAYPRCRLLHWSPFDRVTLEALAEPFGIDLDASRRDTRDNGADLVPDHPLLSVPDLIQIKSERSPGRYDVTCPWVAEHTGAADDGAAIFTNADGSMGFKCHHGSCQHRTGHDLMEWLEAQRPGFRQQYKLWQIGRSLGQCTEASVQTPIPSPTPQAPETIDPVPPTLSVEGMMQQLRGLPPTEPEATKLALAILQAVDDRQHAERLPWWEQVRDHMLWTKRDLERVIRDARDAWYAKTNEDFFKDAIFVSEQNAFHIRSKRMFLTPEAFQNTYAHLDDEARNRAIYEGLVEKVDRVDFRPGEPEIFVERGVRCANSYTPVTEMGEPGDVSRWLDHFAVLGWSEHQDHLLKWMAYTLRYPERKINHAIVLGGREGVGKDFLLYPLMQAMKDVTTVVHGEELFSQFNEYLLNTKWLHVNETETGEHQDAARVTSKLKPLTTQPPMTLRVNCKGLRPLTIQNVLNVSMTTNSTLPLRTVDTRRYFAVWSDLSVRDEEGNVSDEWKAYWRDRWTWMEQSGWRHVIYYLRTEVDLSDFNPGDSPQVTEFLKDIHEVSRGDTLNLVERLIQERFGLFACDILSPQQIHETIVNYLKFHPEVLVKAPSNTWLSRKMVEHGLAFRLHASTRSTSYRLLVLRDHTRYASMPGTHLITEWQRQVREVREGVRLSVVNTDIEEE